MKKTLVLFISAGIFCCSCNSEYPNMFDLDTFNKQTAAWKALGITSYRFTARLWMNVPSSQATVTVRLDTEPEVVFDPLPDEFGQTTKNPFYSYEGATIDELFASIRKSAVNTSMREWYIIIRYNEEYHYTEYYGVHPKNNQERGAGSWFEITHFEVLDNSEQ